MSAAAPARTRAATTLSAMTKNPTAAPQTAPTMPIRNLLKPKPPDGRVDVHHSHLLHHQVGGRVVAEDHHQLHEVTEGEREAGAQLLEDARAGDLISLPEDHPLVEADGPPLHLPVELDDDGDLEDAGGREDLVAVQGSRFARSQVLDGHAEPTVEALRGRLHFLQQAHSCP